MPALKGRKIGVIDSTLHRLFFSLAGLLFYRPFSIPNPAHAGCNSGEAHSRPGPILPAANPFEDEDDDEYENDTEAPCEGGALILMAPRVKNPGLFCIAASRQRPHSPFGEKNLASVYICSRHPRSISRRLIPSNLRSSAVALLSGLGLSRLSGFKKLCGESLCNPPRISGCLLSSIR